MGFDMGNSDGHFERDDPHSYGRFDGTKALQQQPKLAPLPTTQNPMVIIFGTVMLSPKLTLILPKFMSYQNSNKL
jgi:ATP-dependent RNA helicase DDX5/DBP2